MGKYKAGKQTEAITAADFIKILDKGHYVKAKSHRALITLLYYSGARISEILRLDKEKFDTADQYLTVLIPAMKKGMIRGRFFLDVEKPGVAILKDIVDQTRKGRLVFPFTRITAWNIVKRAGKAAGYELYPHFFRLNRCVQFLDNPKFTRNQIRQWFAWKALATIENYTGYSIRTTKALSQDLD